MENNVIEINAQTGEVTQRELTPEEIAQMQEIEEVEIPYEQRAVSLIREKYSIDDELAVSRQRESKPDEWNEYFDYCEWCKSESNKLIQL